MAAQHAGGDYATRYKFNGKELDPQTGYYYFGARYYDPVVSRWLSIDPLAERYPGFSPYNYTANNPVMLVDPDGRKFTNNAWKWVNKLINYMDNKLNWYNKRIARIYSKLQRGKIDHDKAIKKIRNLVSNKMALSKKFDAIRQEISELADSDQVYDVVYDPQGTDIDITTGKEKTKNKTLLNLNNGNVEITVSFGTNIPVFGHELKHAYQFEIGELSIRPTDNGDSYELLYDIHDELEAYQRQALLGSRKDYEEVIKNDYSFLPDGPINIYNHPRLAPNIDRPRYLQAFANMYNQAFRVNGVTYLPRKR